VLSGRSLCDRPITRPEEFYWLCCVIVCDLETSWIRRPWLTGGSRARNSHTQHYNIIDSSWRDKAWWWLGISRNLLPDGLYCVVCVAVLSWSIYCELSSIIFVLQRFSTCATYFGLTFIPYSCWNGAEKRSHKCLLNTFEKLLYVCKTPVRWNCGV
jgi:hypothetical protein